MKIRNMERRLTNIGKMGKPLHCPQAFRNIKKTQTEKSLMNVSKVGMALLIALLFESMNESIVENHICNQCGKTYMS